MQLNQAIHLWAYRTLAERAEARRRAPQDREWQTAIAASAPLLPRQKTGVPTPTPFSPLR